MPSSQSFELSFSLKRVGDPATLLLGDAVKAVEPPVGSGSSAVADSFLLALHSREVELG